MGGRIEEINSDVIYNVYCNQESCTCCFLPAHVYRVRACLYCSSTVILLLLLLFVFRVDIEEDL